MPGLRVLALLLTMAPAWSGGAEIPHAVPGAALSGLSRSLAQYADSVAPGVRLGLSVRAISDNALLHGYAGSEWFVPASTLKTVVTATALQTMGPAYAPEVRIHLQGARQGRRFEGIVRVEGRGDPNISGRYYDDDALRPLRDLADSLRTRGIDTIVGSLQADTSFYAGGRKPETWRARHFDSWYGAEISALSFNDNCVRLVLSPGAKPGDAAKVVVDPDVGYVQIVNNIKTVKDYVRNPLYSMDSLRPSITLGGSLGVRSQPTSLVLPVRDPAAYFMAAFRKALQSKGITVVESSAVYAGMSLDSIRYSAAPLLSMLDEINQRSQNLHAEMLLRNLGQWRYGEGSAAAGIRAEHQFLAEAGLPTNDFVMVDGSGLSSENRVKPDAVTALLAYMAHQARGPLYMASFGQPGVTGVSAFRLSDLEAAHRARIKTGYIGGVHGLAGYIFTQTHDTLAVAVYLNGTDKLSDAKGRALVDSVWSRLHMAYNMEFSVEKEAMALWREGAGITGLQARLDFFSQRLKGRPYVLGPLGEGRAADLEKGPLMNLAAFDCVTYIEHVMALAYAANAQDVFDLLQDIRYRKGHVDYRDRNHYFVEDWIRNNAARVALLGMPGDTTEMRTMDKKKFFASKGMEYAANNPSTRVPYLPMDKAIAWAKTPWTGADTVLGIGFVANFPGICVTHTGFVIARKGQLPVLRHASQLQKQTTEQPLAEYLESRKGKSPGALLFTFR